MRVGVPTTETNSSCFFFGGGGGEGGGRVACRRHFLHLASCRAYINWPQGRRLGHHQADARASSTVERLLGPWVDMPMAGCFAEGMDGVLRAGFATGTWAWRMFSVLGKQGWVAGGDEWGECSDLGAGGGGGGAYSNDNLSQADPDEKHIYICRVFSRVSHVQHLARYRT